MAGIERTLAEWREVGEWWNGESPRHIHRFIDADGVRRETVKPCALEEIGSNSTTKIRRILDEKVSRACGIDIKPSYGKLAGQLGGLLAHTLSGYSFGRSSMIAAEIPSFAAEKGYSAVLLADTFSLAGVREFTDTAEKVGIVPLIGATLELDIGGEVVLVVRDASGYRSLSRLITECCLDEPRGYPLCSIERISRHAEGLCCLTGGDGGAVNVRLIKRDFNGARALLDHMIVLFGRENVYAQIERTYRPWQIAVNEHLLALCDELNLAAIPGGPVLLERQSHFPAQDMLVCIETLCAVDDIDGRKERRSESQPQGHSPPRRELNSERYMLHAQASRDRYRDLSQLESHSSRLVESCERNVLPTRTTLPQFCQSEESVLRQIVLVGASERFPELNNKLRARIDFELERICRLGFARHFLVAGDMCHWAREQRILFSGRGSVVDSLVAYCLGMTRIDPFAFDLHFDRFLPADGEKRPDIDIDFEALRRDDVRNYLVEKYGNEHVATVAAFGTFRTRGLIREIGKVMGIPDASIGYLAKRLHGSVSASKVEEAIKQRPELRDSGIPLERFRWVFELSNRLMDVPRNARSHSSGVVICDQPIADIVPVMQSAMDDVRIIQWDKRSAKHCFDKFDILCLRGNDVLGETQRRVQAIDSNFNVLGLPLDDEGTYRAMRSGELIGIPQSASPAMRQAHIRTQTKNLKDAGIVQAAIRPGVGGAVKLNEYVARRKGKPFEHFHPDLEQILGPTLGIVVFQEQIDLLLQKFAGCTSDEAEILREGIYKNRREGFAEEHRESIIARILLRGYERNVALEVYSLVAQFQGYGFAEGHALAFAEISIRSIWCQQNFPTQYFAALLDAQPAGYYGPCTIVNEARKRGVCVLPPSIASSSLRFGVEDVLSDQDPKIVLPNAGLRVSLSQISEVSGTVKEAIVRERSSKPFHSFFDFVARVDVPRDELETLVLCGFFDGLESNRRGLLWSIPIAYEHRNLVQSSEQSLQLEWNEPEIDHAVEDFSIAEKAIEERRILGLDVVRHLMDFERERVSAKNAITCDEASRLGDRVKAIVVGNPIRLRFPPTSSGKRVMFFDLEDETGLLNVTCFDDVYQRDGHHVICQPYVALRGEAQHRDGHIAFLASRIYPYRPRLAELVANHLDGDLSSDPSMSARKENSSLNDSPRLPIVTADYLIG